MLSGLGVALAALCGCQLLHLGAWWVGGTIHYPGSLLLHLGALGEWGMGKAGWSRQIPAAPALTLIASWRV